MARFRMTRYSDSGEKLGVYSFQYGGTQFRTPKIKVVRKVRRDLVEISVDHQVAIVKVEDHLSMLRTLSQVKIDQMEHEKMLNKIEET